MGFLLLLDCFKSSECLFRQYPQSNWWIGLRSVEDCQCLAGKTDTKSTIEVLKQYFLMKTIQKAELVKYYYIMFIFKADIDFDSLVDSSSPFVPVKTKCPPDFEKICKQPIWRWGYSSIKMGFSRWNVRTGEPNSDLVRNLDSNNEESQNT